MKVLREWFRGRVTDPTEANLERRVVTLLITSVLFGLCLVWLNLMVQDLGYRIASTSKLAEKLDLEYAELRAEFTGEITPERLRSKAELELGLRVPAPGQVMAIRAQP